MRGKEKKIPWESIVMAEPPERLDERIRHIIAAAQIHRSMVGRGTPTWIAVMACCACLVLGFLGSRFTSSLPRHQRTQPAVVIEISPEELPPGFFVSTSRAKASFFGRQLHDVEIEVPKGKEERSL